MRLPLNKHIGRLDRFMASLYEPVSAQSLAVLRMAFGGPPGDDDDNDDDD